MHRNVEIKISERDDSRVLEVSFVLDFEKDDAWKNLLHELAFVDYEGIVLFKIQNILGEFLKKFPDYLKLENFGFRIYNNLENGRIRR